MIDKEILAMMEVEVVEKEIKTREHLLSIMVGNLYPSIIYDELDQLHARLKQLCTSNLTPEPLV